MKIFAKVEAIFPKTFQDKFFYFEKVFYKIFSPFTLDLESV
jgi:hypothetical protein